MLIFLLLSFMCFPEVFFLLWWTCKIDCFNFAFLHFSTCSWQWKTIQKRLLVSLVLRKWSMWATPLSSSFEPIISLFMINLDAFFAVYCSMAMVWIIEIPFQWFVINLGHFLSHCFYSTPYIFQIGFSSIRIMDLSFRLWLIAPLNME